MDPVLDATLRRFYSDLMRQYAVGLGFVALAGCSFVFVSGPPPRHRELPSFDCTTSRIVPILDTVWTGLMALNLLTTLAVNDADWDKQFAPNDPPFSRTSGTVGYAVAAGVGAAGMVYGYLKTGACRRAKEEWTIRMSQGQGTQPGVPPQPGTWPPPAGTPAPGTWPPPAGGPQPGTPPAGGPQPGTWPPPPGTPAPGTPLPVPDSSGPPPPTKTP